MRIAIAGFGAESSTFSAHTMLADHFSVHRGEELLGLYRLDEWAPEGDVEWVPVVRAHGGAGGPLDPAAYDAFAGEIVAGLAAAGPLDGIYLDFHGAAHVAGRDRAEEEILRRIRAAVGDGPVISMSMDTHGNFSAELAALTDLAVCFRHAPHIDTAQIRERAVRQLLRVVRDGRRPRKAYVRVPVLLSGERTSTLVEPAKTVFGGIEPAISRHGVLDASLWVGFSWADEPRNAAAVLVTGYDEDAIAACAAELARAYWDARQGFVIVSEHSGSWDEAIDFAVSRPALPLWISDSGDNVTAGSSGDITYALAATLPRADLRASGLRVLFAGLVDPLSVRAAAAAGTGAVLSRGIGAGADRRYGGPVERDWEVVRLVEGSRDEGTVGAVLRCDGIDVLVQAGRSYFVDPAVIGPMTGRRLPQHAYIPVDGYNVVVVKNGYLFPDQARKAATWFMAITPGGTDLDQGRLDFRRVWRPIWPLDTDFAADLTPVLLPGPDVTAAR